MIRPYHRQKLINAAVFFAGNTRYCGKVKLIKLLYLLDFEHFRQTGRSVTGMEYVALKMGPVPMDLFEEWEDLLPDFAKAVKIEPTKVYDHVREEVKPKVEFDATPFTRRELQLMEQLALRFRDDYCRTLINFTHLELGPWAKIWDRGTGHLARIPYTLAVSDEDPNREAVLDSAAQFQGIAAAVGLSH